MDKEKKARIEAAGLSVGTVQDFLELTEAEAMVIEIKLALARGIKGAACPSQDDTETARGADWFPPSRGFANIERGSASLDMLTRTLLSLGVSRKEVSDYVAA